MGKLGTFVALGVRGRGMIENRSFNLVEFMLKWGKRIAVCKEQKLWSLRRKE